MLAIAFVIRFESAGPVLRRQMRVGRDGVPFELLDFRHMRLDPQLGGPDWTADRRTRVGRAIRRLGIDGLPRLLNVLGGSMGIVGPAPDPPYQAEYFARTIPSYHERLAVKPGLTCWAQLYCPAPRSIEDAQVRQSLDLHYTRNRTILADLAILLATVRASPSRPGGWRAHDAAADGRAPGTP